MAQNKEHLMRGLLSRWCGSVVVVAGTLVALPAAASADSCANAEIRGQQGSVSLPDCRAYEMVSPPFKSSTGISMGHRASDDGNAAAFITTGPIHDQAGAYGGSTYVAHRSPDGWVVRGGTPPITAPNRGLSAINASAADFSADFKTVYFQTNDQIAAGDSHPFVPERGEYTGFDLFSYDVEAGTLAWWSRPAPALLAATRPGMDQLWYIGRSADGERMFFDDRLGSSVSLHASVPAGQRAIYESVNGGDIRVASVADDGTPMAPAAPVREGNWTYSITSSTGNQSVSLDGRRLFFTGTNQGIFVREDGERTLTVSASRLTGSEGTPQRATFMGASRDGSTVYLHGTVALTDDAVPGGNLYRWERDGETLTRLPLPAAMAHSGISDLRLFAESGDRLYFTSSTAIPPATTGSRHLYTWSDSDGLAYIATIGTGSAGGADPRLKATPDGRYLAFTSRLNLAGATVAGHSAIYLYDSQTGELACASCPADGRPASGDAMFNPQDARYAAALLQPTVTNPRAFSVDGGLYFQTSVPLVTADVNDDFDVYEYRDGKQRLISSGRGGPSEIVDNSADGGSVFFVTPDTLTGHDVDGGYPDMYVARVSGGFPEPLPAAERCTGDSCQGGGGESPSSPVVGSLDFVGAGEVATRRRGSLAIKGARTVRGARAALRVRVPAAGRVTVRGSGIRRASRRVSRKATVRVRVRLAARLTARLKQRKSVRVRVRVTYTRAGGTSTSRVLRMTFMRRAARTGGGR